MDGCLPLTPNTALPCFLEGFTQRDLACLSLVHLAREVCFHGEPTEGMRLEIAEARRLRIPVAEVTE